MADNNSEKKILLDVDINASALTADVIEASKKVEELSNKLKELKKDGKQNTEEFVKTNVELKNYRKEVSEGTNTLVKLDSVQKSNNGSIVEMRQSLQLMTSQYNSLSKSERENISVGVKLQQESKKLSDELKELEGGVGNTSRGVGNYKEQIVDAIGSMTPFGGVLSSVTKGVNSLTQGAANSKSGFAILKSGIASTGIGLLILAFAALIDYLRSFDPVIDVVEQAISGFKAAVEVITQKIVSFFQGVTSLGDALSKIGSFLKNPIQGFKDLGKAMGDAAKAAAALTKAQQDIEDVQKIQEINNAKSIAQISQLMLMSRNRTLSEKDRADALKKAGELDLQNFNQRKKIADELVRQAEQDIANIAGVTDADVKRLKKEGIAYAFELKNRVRLTDAQVDALKNAELERTKIMQDSTNRQEKIQNNQDALQAVADAKREKAEQAQQAKREKAQEKIQKAADDLKAAKNEADKEDAKIRFEQSIAGLTQQEQELERLKADYQARIDARKKFGLDTSALQEEEKAKKAEIDLKYAEKEQVEYDKKQEKRREQAKADEEYYDQVNQAMADSEQSLADAKAMAWSSGLQIAQEVFGKQTFLGKAAFLASKVMALAEIKMNLAKTISGIQAAPLLVAGLPLTAPAMAAQILAAKITAGISAAMVIASTVTGFSKGGYYSDGSGSVIKGEGTGTSDSINARLSNGEIVMNAVSSSMFRNQLSAMNVAGGGRSFTSGVSQPSTTQFAKGGMFLGNFGARMDSGINQQKLIAETAVAVANSMPRQVLVIEDVQAGLSDKTYIEQKSNI